MLNSVMSLLDKLKKSRIVAVRELAGLAGQIISTQAAMGKVVQLKSREMFNSINSKASWNAPVLVSNGAMEELRFWRSQIRALNGRPLQETFQFAHNIYSDASSVGCRGFIEEQEGSQVTGTWSQV